MLACMRRLHLSLISAAALLVASSGCSTPDTRPDLAALPPVVVAPPVARAPSPPVDADAELLARLQQLAPAADPGVLALAVEARSCAVRNGEVEADARLAVIDYSLPSTRERMWVFDVVDGRLMYEELVAHGQGTGENMARRFSNRDGSHQTSLGLYRTAETYMGGNGYSLRMDGLDPGFNDNARSRAIVMHGAWYVDPSMIARNGRIGRSHGCPALREGIARAVIDDIKGEQLLFAYSDDAAWLQGARSFACDGRSARQILAGARGTPMGGASVAVAAP
jgi:hypothetical protein